MAGLVAIGASFNGFSYNFAYNLMGNNTTVSVVIKT